MSEIAPLPTTAIGALELASTIKIWDTQLPNNTTNKKNTGTGRASGLRSLTEWGPSVSTARSRFGLVHASSHGRCFRLANESWLEALGVVGLKHRII